MTTPLPTASRPEPDLDRGRRRRRRGFFLLAFACVAVSGAAIALSAGRDATVPGAPAGASRDDGPAPAGGIPAGATVVFRSLDRDDPARYGRIAWQPLRGPNRSRTVGGMVCDRLHFAAGRGLCLTRSGPTQTSTKARIFGSSARSRGELTLTGLPSRTRISPDGRYGTVTSFVSGHSYAEPGTFSTQTTLIDIEAAKPIANLEDFEVNRDGRRFRSADFNFWGVTFAGDSNRFYATLASGDKTYLVRGDIADRSAVVLRENAECPSLSPDGTHVVYKKRVGDPAIWRFHALDLESGREVPLSETRPVDDQVEWLDDGQVLYRTGEEVWAIRTDGGGSPRRLLAAADSPAVLR